MIAAAKVLAYCCSCAVKKQTGVTLRYMLDFGANPVEKQLRLSAQFLHNELPVRLAHRVAELENLPYGLSAKPHVLKVFKLWTSKDLTKIGHSLYGLQTSLET